MFYFVMHTVEGQTRPYGPYKTKDGAKNALARCAGGEADIFVWSSSDRVEALQAYQSEALDRL